MKNYVFIYQIVDFSELGGGIYYECFEELDQVTKYLNEVLKDKRAKILFCGEILKEINFKPVETVISWEPEF